MENSAKYVTFCSGLELENPESIRGRYVFPTCLIPGRLNFYSVLKDEDKWTIFANVVVQRTARMCGRALCVGSTGLFSSFFTYVYNKCLLHK